MANAQIVRCDACGTVNRVAAEGLRRGLEPVCGHCKALLRATPGVIAVTDGSFENDVQESRLPVLLDLWAPWCGPCRMLSPVLEQLAAELHGHVRVAKLNVDENPGTAARFAVRGIPTVLMLKNGQEVDRIVGVQSRPEILRRIERAFGVRSAA